MMLFQDYPFVHKHFHIPFNYTFLLGLSSWLENVHISAFWGLGKMCKCFLKATVNAGNYSQSSSGLEEGSLRPHVWEALREAASTILRMPKKLTASLETPVETASLETPVEIRRCFKLSVSHILLDGYNSNCSGIW